MAPEAEHLRRELANRVRPPQLAWLGHMGVEGECCGRHVFMDIPPLSRRNRACVERLGTAARAEAIELGEGTEAGQAGGGGGSAAVCHRSQRSTDNGGCGIVVVNSCGQLGIG